MIPGEIRTPEGHSADRLRTVILDKFNMSLGNGLGRIEDRVFRVGHMGVCGAAEILTTLGAIERALYRLGARVELGAALAAAQRALANAAPQV